MIVPALFKGTTRLMLAAAVAATLAAAPARAIGLLEAYEAALKNDPNYTAAVYENIAGKEERNIGRSGLLPQLAASYAASRNHADITTISNSVLGQQTSVTHPQYISRNANLSLRQPLVNFEATARYREGVARTKISDTQFAGHQQEMVIRVVGAYLDALFASEQVNLGLAQREFYREQLKVNGRLFDKGEASRTDVIETQARLELAEAQLIESQDNRDTAMAQLTAIVGFDPGTLAPLSADFHATATDMASLEDWKKKALASNLEIRSLTLAVDVAREQVNKGKAGHMPRLDFVANYTKSAADTISTNNQESTNRSLGIQLSVPLYAGGYHSAVTRQAVASLERAKANLDASVAKTLVDVRKEYAMVGSTIQRSAALERAVEAATLLIKATEQSIKGGVRINADLLSARQQLYTSQRDLAQARYGYLLAGLRLRAAAGTLGGDDVRAVSKYFR
jgi:protease secretion system outer membrane protein